MKKRILLSLGVAAVAAFTLAVKAAPVHADDTWTPVATLGTSLTSSQESGTLSTLENAANVSNVSQLTVNGDTLVKYLNPSGSTFTSGSNVYSSALVQKTSSGGINVKIVNYNGVNNITTITADQYRNAALTAGVTNANIYVTSAVAIDGSGALAGVYAAFAENGDNLSSSQINAAQSEVSTLSGITNANKDKDGYSDKQLNNAVAGAKEKMASESDNGSKTLTQTQIGNIVDSELNSNNLTNVITNNQRTEIINLLVKVQSSGALSGSGFKDQAAKLGTSIQNSAKSLFSSISSKVKSLDTQQNRNFLQKIWDSIVSFFQGIIRWIQQLA